MVVEETKEKVLRAFRETFPLELSIKEAAKRARLTRETTSKYIGILAAEGALRATRTVGNTNFFVMVPDVDTRGVELAKNFESFLRDSFELNIFEDEEMETLEKSKKILAKRFKKEK